MADDFSWSLNGDWYMIGFIYVPYRGEDSDLEDVSDLDSDVAEMSDNDDFDPDFKYGDNMFMDEETKSRFTSYSMSSSVIRRNEGLTLLDDRFEKVNIVVRNTGCLFFKNKIGKWMVLAGW